MHKIQMADLFGQYQRIKGEVDEEMQEVITNTSFINGPAVKAFRKELGEFNQVNHVITCGNGTDALQLALMALDCQPGDEIILPVFTYVATAEVIALLKLTPVFVDVCPDRFTLDLEQVKARVTSKTRAIVPVHLFGQCAEMEALLAIAEKNNLKIVEDAAQSLGAQYTFSNGHTQYSGTIGDLGTTSFFPSKNLGCFGDGGAIFTNHEALGEMAWLMANHGQKVKYQHEVIGCNSRLDTLQAAVLRVKLKYLKEYEAARRSLADFYDAELAGLDGLITPKRFSDTTHVFHQYTLKVEERRDELKTYLAEAGIPAMVYYPFPLHLQKAYAQREFPVGSFPVAEQLCKEVLSLPMHTEMKEEQREYIVRKVKEFFK
ncbi:DegT/DnrJ/EryC1/StrS family aminotransferase [Flexithrix dorotheae]|uniref:DegT/DnrJ/EryC1/StrS family aminotransferase n=1 Tax=Flexithrix dorotheae TaxID=70993 RepID=UPI0003695768|nr:DegT/DnrJ/EryC1/StrS family aminotransferase [Flexithrix dorotheae]